MKRVFIALILGFAALVAFDSCSKTASEMIVGHWELSWVADYEYCGDFRESAIWVFESDGTLRFESDGIVCRGTYHVDGSKVSLSYDKNDSSTPHLVTGFIKNMNEDWMDWRVYDSDIFFNRTDESVFPSGDDPLQPLQFEWEGHCFNDGETVVCTSDDSGSIELVQHMQIHNKTDEAKSIVIEQEVVQAVDGVSNYFCWGTSYNADVNTSAPVAVAAQGLSDAELSFHAVYDDQAYGVFIVRYYAYEENHPEDRISITVRFKRYFGETPEGIIKGLFTLNAFGDQVHFSQGNLQYQASTDTWRFAEHQWDFVGEDNTLASPNYSGWIDLFAWGTSGYDHGAVCYQPWSTSMDNGDYWAYGQSSFNLDDQTGTADWGYNPISNGGNMGSLWRTMTISEWEYVFYTRYTASGIRFAKAVVNNVKGFVLLPDDWDASIFSLNNTDSESASYASNILSAVEWNSVMEASGAVFLPKAGLRTGDYYSERCDYWSSTGANDYSAYGMVEDYGFAFSHNRYDAKSVRLVCNAGTF